MVDPKLEPLLETLSPREHETLLLMLGGLGEREVGERLGLSRQTVHVYVKNLYRTFRVRDRGRLLAQFIPPATVDYVGRRPPCGRPAGRPITKKKGLSRSVSTLRPEHDVVREHAEQQFVPASTFRGDLLVIP